MTKQSDVLKKILNQEFSTIEWEYNKLPQNQKLLISEKEFEKLKKKYKV